MPPDLVAARADLDATPWQRAVAFLGLAWAGLVTLTFPQWREMAHQWWDIDTYNHILLVPAIVAWLVWLRRAELARVEPKGWWPGLGCIAAGLGLWLCGRLLDINLFAQAGAVAAMQGAVLAILGLRASLVLAFPLLYAGFLVPFGDELIPVLQHATAEMTVALTHLSGVPAIGDGLFIDTPAGRFVVAEECSGVKFLIAMVALSVLVGWTGMTRWKHRLLLVLGGAIVSILANGVRAWGTIFAAQHIGIERAGGFDHIVYGWVFFAVVIAAVMGTAWPYLDRLPEDAGLTADEAAAHPLAALERFRIGQTAVIAAIAGLTIAFAALAALV